MGIFKNFSVLVSEVTVWATLLDFCLCNSVFHHIVLILVCDLVLFDLFTTLDNFQSNIFYLTQLSNCAILSPTIWELTVCISVRERRERGMRGLEQAKREWKMAARIKTHKLFTDLHTKTVYFLQCHIMHHIIGKSVIKSLLTFGNSAVIIKFAV